MDVESLPQVQIHRVKTLYWIGDVIWLKIRAEDEKGIITEVHVTPIGVKYLIGWPDATESIHYEMELTHEFVPDFGAKADS